MSSAPKVSKKRKMGLLDSPSSSFTAKLQTEKPNIQLGNFHRQTLTPTITISSVHPPRPRELSAAEFNKSWEIQKTVVATIFSNQTNKGINYVTSARLSENLCRFGKSEALFTVLVNEIRLHVQQLKTNILDSKDNLLINLKNSWETFGSQLLIIKNIFMELDRSFVLPKTKFSSIIQLGKHIFSEIVLDTEGFCDGLVDKVLDLIQLDRDGKEIDRKLIQSIINMMIELSYYTTYFEPKFLATTNVYYRKESQHLIQTLSIPEYIQHANKRREQELEERLPTYLDMRTKRQLDQTITRHLIYSKTETIVKKGFSDMMDNQSLQPLKILYDLLPESQLDILKHAFGEYVKVTGVALIQNPANDSTMISSLLKLKKKLDRVLKECFQENGSLANVLKENCEYFINTRGIKPAELLAKFFDSKLKISSKKRNQDNDLVVLNKALVLFRFIQSKDAFEAYYKRFLAKRLLLNKSASKSMEIHVLEKLQTECGYEFTKNLDNMFNDMEISDDLHNVFKRNLQDIPIHVRVIAQATWPSYPNTDMHLPEKMVGSQKLYEDFYTSRFNGRKLIWQNSLSSCVVTGYFPKGSREISCSLPQALILLLFNENQALSFDEIERATGLTVKDLIPLLTSLSSQPFALIINETGEAITQQDRFRFNPEFESPSNKIKLPPALVDQITEEQRDVESKVQINRQYQLEAAIVRILKSKQKMHHNNLMDVLFTELKYPLEANDVKKRIEFLIERDYIKRHRNDPSLYIYQS